VRRCIALLMSFVLLFALAACGKTENTPSNGSSIDSTQQEDQSMQISEEFVLIKGGSFQMGSPDSEAWRSADETQHSVTVSDFYMSKHELTQREYAAVIGSNPSSFSGDDLPVENVSWLDAIAYCNARSKAEGLTPAYTVDGQTVPGTEVRTATVCQQRRSGNMPAVPERQLPSISPNHRAQSRPITMDTILMALRIIIFHRETCP